MTTQQAPIQSGLGAHTTAREALGTRDLSGAIAIVTGGYSGIGLETTRTLAAAGATVIVPARTPDKAKAAIASLDPAVRERVELGALELSDPASIDAFAARFVASGRALHLLINNAGTMYGPLARDARGFEEQLSVNHLGHFQLTVRLWSALRAARGARVVALSSRGHHRAGVEFEDPSFERRAYDKAIAYGQAKTANSLFALGVDARGEAHGVRAFAVHPGAVLSDLVRFMSDADLAAYGILDRRAPPPPELGFKTPEQGAATSVWAATSAQLAGMGGVYCENCDVSTIDAVTPMGEGKEHGVRPWAIDHALAERLWTASEGWTGARLSA